MFCKALNKILSVLKTLLVHGNVEIGKGSILFWKASIRNKGGKIIIGDNVIIGRDKRNYHCGMPFYTTLFTDAEEAVLSIGDNCRINGAYIHCKKHISIGKNCVIASGVNILDSNGHAICSENRTIGGDDEAKDIIIGENVWIGINAIILKDTVIGNNCIVSAGSVVKGPFEDNTIIQGNFARSVKKIDPYQM